MSLPRSCIYDVLHQLNDIIPKKHQAECNKLKSKIAYTAPELMQWRWNQVYQFLVKITPREDAPWVQDAVALWNSKITHAGDPATPQLALPSALHATPPAAD